MTAKIGHWPAPRQSVIKFLGTSLEFVGLQRLSGPWFSRQRSVFANNLHPTIIILVTKAAGLHLMSKRKKRKKWVRNKQILEFGSWLYFWIFWFVEEIIRHLLTLKREISNEIFESMLWKLFECGRWMLRCLDNTQAKNIIHTHTYIL